jgi:hypothetical protein
MIFLFLKIGALKTVLYYGLKSNYFYTWTVKPCGILEIKSALESCVKCITECATCSQCLHSVVSADAHCRSDKTARTGAAACICAAVCVCHSYW